MISPQNVSVAEATIEVKVATPTATPNPTVYGKRVTGRIEPTQIHYLRLKVTNLGQPIRVFMTISNASAALQPKGNINLYIVTEAQRRDCTAEGRSPWQPGCNSNAGNFENGVLTTQLSRPDQTDLWVAVQNRSDELALYELTIENGSFEKDH